MKDRLKIAAYVHPASLKMLTGVSMLTLNMVKALASDPSVELCLLASADELGADLKMPPELGLEGIPVIPLPWTRFTREALWLGTDWPSVDRYLPPETWVYCSMESFIPASRCRRIVTVHHLEPSMEGSLLTARGIRNRIADWRLRRALNTATVVVAQSAFTSRQVHKRFGVPLERIVVVGSGASEEVFSTRDDAVLDDAVLGHGPILLAVGALNLRKGSDYLIALARELRLRNSPLKIVCTAGTYGDASQIAKAKQEPNMILLSFVSRKELLAYMRESVCLVCLSRLEGFGLPIVEAMAAGLPVVAAASSAIPETLGGAGVLVNAANSREVADAVDRVYRDEEYRASLIENGLARARAMFTWEACMQRLLAALN